GRFGSARGWGAIRNSAPSGGVSGRVPVLVRDGGTVGRPPLVAPVVGAAPQPEVCRIRIRPVRCLCRLRLAAQANRASERAEEPRIRSRAGQRLAQAPLLPVGTRSRGGKPRPDAPDVPTPGGRSLWQPEAE